jgi:hypothetical protein
MKDYYGLPAGVLQKTPLSAVFALLFYFALPHHATAQRYLGAGVHFAPPVRIDYCCNPWLQYKPVVIPAVSFSYKKVWENKRKRKWYREIGLTTIGLNFNEQIYFNDTVSVWSEFNIGHVGFPSVTFGMGRVFALPGRKIKPEFSIGLEGSFRISHDLGGITAGNSFGIGYSVGEVTFPLFLRLNAGYAVHFKVFNQVPGHLQIYTKLSFQDIARGPQYLVDPVTGVASEGTYRLNNSELGLKIYADIGKEHYKINWEKSKKGPKRKKGGRSNYRLSVDGQIYVPPATEYFIPKVDSFSLTGLKFSLTNQIGIKAEIIHYKNEDWSTLLGIGVGKTTNTTHFIATPSFTTTGQLIDTPNGGYIGNYLIPNIGLAYKHPLGSRYLQHSVSATFAVPVTKQEAVIQVVERAYLTLPPHLAPKLLDGEFNNKYGRNNVLFGLEYQPEILFHLDKRLFYGFGLVFNYSPGAIAIGRVTVNNEQTQYYGGMTQGFSKIGITARVGWNSSRQYR